MLSTKERLEAWIATRPPVVQLLARQFPPGARILDADVCYYVLGFTEGVDPLATGSNGDWGGALLIVSENDPFQSEAAYEAALAAKQYICPCHLRTVH